MSATTGGSYRYMRRISVTMVGVRPLTWRATLGCAFACLIGVLISLLASGGVLQLIGNVVALGFGGAAITGTVYCLMGRNRRPGRQGK